jgi:hypothetical protein
MKEDGSVDTMAWGLVSEWSNVVRWEHNLDQVCRGCRDMGLVGFSESGGLIL